MVNQKKLLQIEDEITKLGYTVLDIKQGKDKEYIIEEPNGEKYTEGGNEWIEVITKEEFDYDTFYKELMILEESLPDSTLLLVNGK
ncbi:MAG: hypothetical protein J1F35_06580 [Erysipelotrichales bacterium]|nr:hypothetical protein [Erysipelotrichales bacterium]